jgi:uncharacterized protein
VSKPLKIQVNVKPNSRQETVEDKGQGEYLVRVNAPPSDGRANERLIELLAGHFGVPKSRVVILRGQSGRKKLVEIS